MRSSATSGIEETARRLLDNPGIGARRSFRHSDLQDLRARCGISDSRMSLVPLAVLVLKELVRVFKPKDVAISSYGIREGMLFEQMPRELRERDPLETGPAVSRN